MCGICGEISLIDAKVDANVLDAMVASLRHRGPDDQGIFVEGNIGLGHSRLSIIDPSPSGHQPMFDAHQEIVIVFNGEIYNYRELRKEFLDEGVKLRSQCDTEVILYLYRKYGTNCPKYLRGMFAFAIWDRKTKRLFAARDRMGIKPFYYYLDSRRLAFASEIKAIVQIPDADLALSLPAIANYFTYGHSFAPQTIYQRIQKLPPGHWMMVEETGVTLRRYWEIPVNDTSNGDFAGCAKELLRLLADSVRCHLIADVPVGVFLSGGTDSSLIAALAARQKSEPVQTFSVGFDVGGHYNELASARQVATAIGANHHELVVESFSVPSLLEKLVWHYDEPFADAACMPTYLISEFARRSVKVILSGEGGDEVFGGYRRYITQLLSPYYRCFAWFLQKDSSLRQTIESRRGLRRVKKVLESFDFANDDERYAHWLTSFTPALRQEFFEGSLQEFERGYDAAEIYHRRFAEVGSDSTNRLLYADMKTWLPDTYLEKVDKATMAVSLEARVPLLDHFVVEYAFSLPGIYKISKFRKKRILRAAAAGLVPDSILTKPKHGFSVPLDEWFRGPLAAYAREVMFDGRLESRGYIRREAIERLLKLHLGRRNDYGAQIWQLLNFELWHRSYVDASAAEKRSHSSPSLLGRVQSSEGLMGSFPSFETRRDTGAGAGRPHTE
jgi:asparagine synthase (glutamine-hydrolysing)